MNHTGFEPLAEPHQELLPHLRHVPALMRDHGLAEAHARPYVGIRTADGIRSWRTSPADAWRIADPFPLVEWPRTGNSFPALVLDVDNRDAIERVHTWAMTGGPLPEPNFTLTRSASGHLHVAWTLTAPVLFGELTRPAPLATFARIAEFYRAAVGADDGYVGVLAGNPIHPDYDTAWQRTTSYTLADLAAPIPAGWKRPKVATTGAGRNCNVFKALCRAAGSPALSDDDVRAIAGRLNAEAAPEPMSTSEIRGIVKSVLRYRARWRAQGWHQPAFFKRQATRGRSGGRVSKGGGRPRTYATDAERQRAYRVRQSVTKQAYTDDPVSGREAKPIRKASAGTQEGRAGG